MREIIEKYYRREHSALSEEDIEDQNCIHTPDEMINFALSVVKNCSIPHVVGRSEQLLTLAQYMCEHQNNLDGKTAKEYLQDFLSQ